MTLLPFGALQIRVVSRAVTGDVLTQLLTPFARYPCGEFDAGVSGRALEDCVEYPWEKDQTSLKVEFALVHHAPAPPTQRDDDLESFPCVEVTIAKPLPPARAVGVLYDEVVRERHQWHLALPDDQTAQDREVAIRTWMIGLLMHEGLSFSQAVHRLEARWGFLSLGQEADRQARNRLIARVPEARPFLRPR